VIWAVVLAAGTGARFGARKQFETIAGCSLVDHAVTAAAICCDAVVVVLPPGHMWSGPPVERSVTGGETRAASVRRGLAAVPVEADVIAIHDAAHPLAPPSLFRSVIAAVRAGAAAAVPVLPVAETIAPVDLNRLGDPIPREGLGLVQMPHAFRAEVLREAHATEPETIDEAWLLRSLGVAVATVPGDPTNIHVTTPAGLHLARRLAGDA
jgi:2-C-methyl-D-erythritol 4-phosphate cytidylyltransferase